MPHVASEVTPEVLLVESIEGWLAGEEIVLLMDAAARVPRGQAIVEIGNYRGRSSAALALGARQGLRASVYSVDPHVEFVGARGGRFGPEDQAQLYANLTRAGVGAEVKVVSLDSRSVAGAWSGAPLGLLFLDGDHRYEAVAGDLDAWSRHLAPGALVAFDDCDYADVARLVDERVRAGELFAQAAAGKLGCFRTRG